MNKIDNSITLILTEDDWKKINEFASTINIYDIKSIADYAISLQKKGANLPNILLKQLKTDLSTEVNDTIRNLLKELEQFTPDDEILKNPMQNRDELKKIRSDYTVINKKLNELFSILQEQELILRNNSSTLSALHTKTIRIYRSIQMYIEAGKKKLTEIEQNLSTPLPANVSTNEGLIPDSEISHTKMCIMNFKARLDSLSVTQSILESLIMQIRTHITTNEILLQKVSTTYRKTIPEWRRGIKVALQIGDVVDAIYATGATTTSQDFSKTNQSLTESISELRESLASNKNSIAALNEVYLASKQLQKGLTS